MKNEVLGRENKILMVMTRKALESLDLKNFEWIHLEKLWSIEDEEDFEMLVNQLRAYTKLGKKVTS